MKWGKSQVEAVIFGDLSFDFGVEFFDSILQGGQCEFLLAFEGKIEQSTDGDLEELIGLGEDLVVVDQDGFFDFIKCYEGIGLKRGWVLNAFRIGVNDELIFMLLEGEVDFEGLFLDDIVDLAFHW